MSILSGAQNVVINNSKLISQVFYKAKGTGLQTLLDASIPGASHDSSERYPPPICHPRTRQDYIQKLIQWSLNSESHTDRIAWVKGPAGVGKSAIAQSCAEALSSKEKLGATFFFSRPNHRDDPGYFFTSLAYQLTERYDTYGAFLDREVHRRPNLVKKSLPHQFHDLFVVPFTDPAIWEEVAEPVIIVDGLDECSSMEAQVDIIKIIGKSVQERTTPFLWIFLSRLEHMIVATFDLPQIRPLSREIDLPISRDVDKEILLFLAENLQEIGRVHGFALPWPPEEKIWVLVDFSAGLFACAHAIVHFVSTDNLAGPEGQLDVVLQIAKHSVTTGGTHPLSALDNLYTLVMERVPLTILQTIQCIFLATRMPRIRSASDNANLLGLSESQFRNACRCLHAVMTISGGDDLVVAFYHASFMDFLEDPVRSRHFSIWPGSAIVLLDEVLTRLDQMLVDLDSHGGFTPGLNIVFWPGEREIDRWNCYYNLTSTTFHLLSSISLSANTQVFRALQEFDFRKFCLGSQWVARSGKAQVKLLVQNLRLRPRKLFGLNTFRSLLAHGGSRGLPRYYTVGRGEKKALLMVSAEPNGLIMVQPFSLRRLKKWMKVLYKEQQRVEVLLT